MEVREAVRFGGVLSLERNGGFASIRARTPPGFFHDAAALRLVLQGDGRTYDLTLRRADVPLRAGSYRVRVATEKGPTEVTLPLHAFRPTSFGRPVPGAPAYVLGIINLRGNVVSVLDTRLRFGLPKKETDDSTRIIIIELESQTIGILVDSVAEVEDVQGQEVDTAPGVGNEESSRYIAGVVSRASGLLILVDVQRLLSEQEWQDVEAT